MLFDLDEIVKKIKKVSIDKRYILGINIALVILLITFFSLGLLPLANLKVFGVLFVTFLVFSLYFPRWSFAILAGVIMLEGINLVPVDIGLNLRPYQFCTAALMTAVIFRRITKKCCLEQPNFKLLDLWITLLVIAGFVSAFTSSGREIALKQSVIILSFGVVYFLSKVFIVRLFDVKKNISLLLGSSLVVILYGILQNVMFLKGWASLEVMPGRPNATFTEPDWLGMFLVFVLALLYSFAYTDLLKENKGKYAYYGLGSLFLITNILLIIAVSRSAWLGAAAVSVTYFFVTVYFVFKKVLDIKKVATHFLMIASWIVVSLAVVQIFNLTNFELLNRFQSTGSGMQEITVSCEFESNIPEEVSDTRELMNYGCRHINLEEIEYEKATGHFIGRTRWDDPNVNIRAEIYNRSWSIIKRNPIFGIGWGNIYEVLGTDERGAGLNSSNIFLEVWLGAGILGLISFVMIITSIFYRGMRLILKEDQVFFGLILTLGMIAIVVPNLFNAGIMLGFIWFFFGLSLAKNE